jgi:hypothetical protein
VQLSILIPTQRHGMLVCSRLAQACSWASPNVEVIIRDNSGDAEKRNLLARFRRENCNIIAADPCDAITNVSELMRLAKGDFIFLIADDDFCFDHAIAALPGLFEQFGKDSSVAGVTGGYLVESGQGSSIVTYQNIESEDVTARVSGYLSANAPNILHYAPVRREIVQRVFAFMRTLPFFFSFHDQVISLLYLLNGRFVRMKRLLYLYDLGPWEKPESAQRRDVDFYREAGLDPAINALHWYLCGFEGAVLVRNASEFPDHPLAQRQAIADRWFSSMFIRFKGQPRLTFDSPHAAEAQKLCAKLQTASGQLAFQGMLAEICALIALFSADSAQRYFDFWDATINRRQPAPRPAETMAQSRPA